MRDRKQSSQCQIKKTHNGWQRNYVAGLRLYEIDFLFGGSTLLMLAKKDTEGKNDLAAMVPRTKFTLVAKQDEYIQNYADTDFQFEQFVRPDYCHP
jgi:hypothetical protein